MKKKKNIALVLLLFLLSCVVVLLFLPKRSEGMDATFPAWYYLRVVFFAMAATMGIIALILFFSNLKKIIGFFPNFLKYRPLLYLLVKRDFYTKYRGSILGILWSLLDPLGNMAILTLVFSTMFKRTIEHFPAYALSGTIIFSCFMEATGSGMTSLVKSSSLLRKVYVPKYIFPFSKTVVPFVNLLFSILALVIVMLLTKVPFHMTILLLPVLICYLFVFCLGVSLVLSTAYVFFRDVQHLYAIMRTGLRYMSAIFYDISIVPVAYMPIFALNPILHYIRFFRSIMLDGTFPTSSDHLVCGGMAVVSLCLGLFCFYKNQDKFVLYI